jgi:predicted TIM-barrel fold metal-dependent hydrolase
MTIDGYCALGHDREYDLTVTELIRAMDLTEVAQAVIAPIDRFLAVDNRAGNDFILEAAYSHRSRLIPSCSANPWFGSKAVHELERAIGEGARMLVLHPFIQGYQTNDELVWPLIDVAGLARIPVYIHTGQPGNSTPWQVVDLADRYRDVDFIMGHCGATDFWNDVITAGKAATNVYLESSLARPFNFATYLQDLGKSKGIMGSFVPLNDLNFEWTQMRQLLPPEEWCGVYGENLNRLLVKRGAL